MNQIIQEAEAEFDEKFPCSLTIEGDGAGGLHYNPIKLSKVKSFLSTQIEKALAEQRRVVMEAVPEQPFTAHIKGKDIEASMTYTGDYPEPWYKNNPDKWLPCTEWNEARSKVLDALDKTV